MLPTMVKKTMDQHVMSNLASITILFTSFDLWKSCGIVDIFTLVIKFLNGIWVPMHIIVRLFEMSEATK